MVKQLMLGSLFDGIGAFPLAATRAGIKPIWASEIVPFRVEVTSRHFPDILHLGDICNLNGGETPPVDIITFGSPCQDLSVAGNREGLEGAKSTLFFEAIRVIREMRRVTNGQYPTFAVWENVPGAFSASDGQDFRTVLAEIMETEIPMPRSGRWAPAGMVRGNGRSLAWRVLDAQYWGVAQRRDRIFIIADFAGQRAPEILFESESLSRDIEAGGEAREEVAASSRSGTKDSGTDYLTGWDNQEKRIVGVDGVAPTLSGADGGGGRTCAGYVFVPEIVGCLNAYDADKYFCNNQAVDAGHVITVRADGRSRYTEDDTAGTLRACASKQSDTDLVIEPKTVGTLMDSGAGLSRPAGMASETDFLVPVAFGPDDQGDIAHAVRSNPSKADKPSSTTYIVEPIAFNVRQDPVSGEVTGALDTDPQSQCVVIDCRNLEEKDDVSGTLQAKKSGGYSLNYQNPVRIGYAVRRLTPTECERLQGFPDDWTAGGSDTKRYQALGDSIAVPCAEFIMRAIAEIEGVVFE